MLRNIAAAVRAIAAGTARGARASLAAATAFAASPTRAASVALAAPPALAAFLALAAPIALSTLAAPVALAALTFPSSADAATATVPVAAPSSSPAPLLNEMFQDHAVLQRDRPIVIWGDARPGERITLEFHGSTAQAHADAAGHWRTHLPAQPAGGPYSLTVRARSGASHVLMDVLVGDVYLCSGQSNMEFPVANTLDAAREIADSANASIRLLTVPRTTSPTPSAHFQTPVTWAAAGPETVRDFSAACFYFARELQKTVTVPLGLIHSSWGGARIEPWMSQSALRSLGGYDQRLDLLRAYALDTAVGDQRMGELWERWWTTNATDKSTPWNEGADSNWRDMPLPMRDWKTWGVTELAKHDGMVWFSRAVTLTAAQAASGASLSIGAIDEVDETWVNGHPIGNTFGYGTERTYRVPPGVLRAGENSIVINVTSLWDAGGMYGPPELLTLQFADADPVSLAGHWRYRFVPESMGVPPRAPWESVSGLTSIYNAMIAPLGSYGLRGVLWYQGESNAGEAIHYQSLLTALMADWRRQFESDLPFLIVQLPQFGLPSSMPTASAWADLREAQRRTVAADSHAALAVTLDVGDAHALHPPDKQAVGSRLARAARHSIYGEALSPSGPVPREAVRRGAQVIVDFDAGPLLTYSAARPIGFELCAADQASCRFVDAAVEATHVRLDAADPSATRVRFCWGDAPVCNLYDDTGLPAGPFEIPIR